MGFLAELLPQVRAQIDDPSYLEGLPESPIRRASSLKEAVAHARDGWAVLVERKRASPGSSNPDLPTVPLNRFLSESSEGQADGISCLATSPAFGGSPKEVAEVVRGSRLPVLFKDFVIDPIQVEAAYRTGASAILLIARLESGGFLELPLQQLALAARARGLEVLLEVHDEDEWSVAEGTAADLFGVNVRDLDSLRFEADAAEETLRGAGPHRPILALSGVSSDAEARRYRGWGADGLLVGSAFARASDPSGFLRTLRVPRPGS